MITGQIGRHEVLLPKKYIKLQLPAKEEDPSYERKGKFALKDWQRRRRLFNLCLYTVSLVIETKVVIGWFKLHGLLNCPITNRPKLIGGKYELYFIMIIHETAVIKESQVERTFTDVDQFNFKLLRDASYDQMPISTLVNELHLMKATGVRLVSSAKNTAFA